MCNDVCVRERERACVCEREREREHPCVYDPYGEKKREESALVNRNVTNEQKKPKKNTGMTLAMRSPSSRPPSGLCSSRHQFARPWTCLSGLAAFAAAGTVGGEMVEHACADPSSWGFGIRV